MKENALTVFYSYSHKDEALREALETHLSILSRNGIIKEWSDRRILPGEEWEKAIDENLQSADLILLLVSPDFIASDYCFSKELTIAIEKHETNKSVVIPIIVRPVDWKNTPFSKIQALPTDAIPVTGWKNQDEAWLNIEQGIKIALEKICKNKIRHRENAGLLSIRDVLTKEIDRLESVFESSDTRPCSGLTSGLADLDHITDGFHPSQLTIIASRPTMGKSDLSLNFAWNVAITEKIPVAYFSMNMPIEQACRRLIASIGHVNNHNLLRGCIEDDEWPRISAAVSVLAEAPLYIDESSVLSIKQLISKIHELKRIHDPKLIVIDSFQHISHHEESSSLAKAELTIPKELKTLAKDLQIPIIVTASLSSMIEARSNKRPLLSDLGNLSSLDEVADIVIFLYRDEVYNIDSLDRGQTELIIAKNANGHVGTIRTTYFPQTSKFIDFCTFDEDNI